MIDKELAEKHGAVVVERSLGAEYGLMDFDLESYTEDVKRRAVQDYVQSRVVASVKAKKKSTLVIHAKRG